MLQLYKFVAGSATQLGSNYDITGVWGSDGVSATITLDMVGTTIRALIDDVEHISVTDSDVTAAGYARSAQQHGEQ